MSHILDSLKVILALKLRLRIDQVDDSQTIERLCGGNSARRNEILADISSEFGVGQMDDAHNKSIEELSGLISGMVVYNDHGPYLSRTIEGMIKEKLPLPRSRVVEYMEKEWDLGKDQVFHVMTMLPAMLRDGDSARAGRLSDIGVGGRIVSEADCLKWIDGFLGTMGFQKRSSVQSPAGIDMEAMNRLKEELSKAGRELLSACGSGLYLPAGEERPVLHERKGFDEKKHAPFVSNWNWARVDMVRMFHEKGGTGSDTAELIDRFRRNASDELLRTARFFASRDRRFEEVVKAVEDGLKWKGKFHGRLALVTGAGPASIACEVVKKILSEGGKVVVSTSNYNYDKVRYFRRLYQEHCSNGSELHLVPADQGDHSDVVALVRWTVGRFGVPDILVPFGAVKRNGLLTDMEPEDSLGSMRVLLHGVEWLVAEVAKHARDSGSSCTCVLPLSPNRGQIGGDASYAEAKLALEAMMNKAVSEYDTFGKFVSLIGCRIGWTRGTGLMADNDVFAGELERRYGIKTYSAGEMAGIIVGLLENKDPETGIVDITGGFDKVKDIGKAMAEIRKSLSAKNDGPEERAERRKLPPDLYAFQTVMERRPHAVKPDKRTVVVVGFGEVSPYGNARSRFEFETHGSLTVSSAFELAWFMGLIRYSNDERYVGWIDARSGEPVGDHEILERYGKYIIEHTGIRAVEKDVAGFDPCGMTVYSDVLLESDIYFPLDDGSSGSGYDDIVIDRLSGRKFIRFKKGSTIKVPRKIRHSRWASGQVPTGFDPATFGISKEVSFQIDRLSVFNFVASAEAFLSAGLTPEELLREFDPSKIGNTQGSGIGGMSALTRLYHDWREDKVRKGDTLQETLINTIPAWLTQSYTGGEGPAVHPVGACATAVVSLSAAYDLITAGRADFVIAGGYDDINPEGAIGFADMGATAPTDDMLAKGIDIRAISRPNDSRRGGFVEAQGGGTMLLTTLEKAVQIGLPVYAALAFTATHSDGYHTSIPAPGLGLFSIAKGGSTSPLSNALKAFGMTADDITVISKHDTSTAANDPNENELHQLIQKEIGRTDGNPLLVHSQKAVLGHAKGGAGAWAANAAVQMLISGLVPGNPNLDDVDDRMRRFDALCFPDRTISLGRDGIRSVLVTSLGFGHVGAAALFVHPSYLFSSLSPGEMEDYQAKLAKRERRKISLEWRKRMGKEPYFEQVKLS